MLPIPKPEPETGVPTTALASGARTLTGQLPLPRRRSQTIQPLVRNPHLPETASKPLTSMSRRPVHPVRRGFWFAGSALLGFHEISVSHNLPASSSSLAGLHPVGAEILALRFGKVWERHFAAALRFARHAAMTFRLPNGECPAVGSGPVLARLLHG